MPGGREKRKGGEGEKREGRRDRRRRPQHWLPTPAGWGVGRVSPAAPPPSQETECRSLSWAQPCGLQWPVEPPPVTMGSCSPTKSYMKAFPRRTAENPSLATRGPRKPSSEPWSLGVVFKHLGWNSFIQLPSPHLPCSLGLRLRWPISSLPEDADSAPIYRRPGDLDNREVNSHRGEDQALPSHMCLKRDKKLYWSSLQMAVGQQVWG